MNYKKIILLVITFGMIIGIIAGCKDNKTDEDDYNTNSIIENEQKLKDNAESNTKYTQIAQINEAIALTKADLYADYYDETNKNGVKSNVLTTFESKTPTDAKIIQDRINSYLDLGEKNELNVKVSYKNGEYMIKLADDVTTEIKNEDITPSIVCDFWK